MCKQAEGGPFGFTETVMGTSYYFRYKEQLKLRHGGNGEKTEMGSSEHLVKVKLGCFCNKMGCSSGEN